MNRTTYFRLTLLAVFYFLTKVNLVNAQMVGSNAYIKGTSAEIGINGAGGFEGVDYTISPPLTGMHTRTGTNYFVPIGTSINDTNYWVMADNRDAQMVMYLCDVSLFHLHSRIAPRNIPDLRVKRYEAAIMWFKMCAVGDVTPELPLLTPRQGNRIRFGGNIKNINSY